MFSAVPSTDANSPWIVCTTGPTPLPPDVCAIAADGAAASKRIPVTAAAKPLRMFLPAFPRHPIEVESRATPESSQTKLTRDSADGSVAFGVMLGAERAEVAGGVGAAVDQRPNVIDFDRWRSALDAQPEVAGEHSRPDAPPCPSRAIARPTAPTVGARVDHLPTLEATALHLALLMETPHSQPNS